MATYEAVNRYGTVVRTFSDYDLAKDYQSDMGAMGSAFTIRSTKHFTSYVVEGIDKLTQRGKKIQTIQPQEGRAND